MTYPTKVETLALQIMDKLPNVGRWQRKFLAHLFVLWLSLRGRYNFTHLARYGGGGRKESTYRNNFARPFDWLAFHTELCRQHLSPDLILAFDPTYLPKSGRHTDGVDPYWSGTAQAVKRGLEASGIAAVDLQDRTALHLLAVQTVLRDEEESLLDYYASILVLLRQQQVAAIPLRSSRCLLQSPALCPKVARGATAPHQPPAPGLRAALSLHRGAKCPGPPAKPECSSSTCCPMPKTA